MKLRTDRDAQTDATRTNRARCQERRVCAGRSCVWWARRRRQDQSRPIGRPCAGPQFVHMSLGGCAMRLRSRSSTHPISALCRRIHPMSRARSRFTQILCSSSTSSTNVGNDCGATPSSGAPGSARSGSVTTRSAITTSTCLRSVERAVHPRRPTYWTRCRRRCAIGSR